MIIFIMAGTSVLFFVLFFTVGLYMSNGDLLAIPASLFVMIALCLVLTAVYRNTPDKVEKAIQECYFDRQRTMILCEYAIESGDKLQKVNAYEEAVKYNNGVRDYKKGNESLLTGVLYSDKVADAIEYIDIDELFD